MNLKCRRLRTEWHCMTLSNFTTMAFVQRDYFIFMYSIPVCMHPTNESKPKCALGIEEMYLAIPSVRVNCFFEAWTARSWSKSHGTFLVWFEHLRYEYKQWIVNHKHEVQIHIKYKFTRYDDRNWWASFKCTFNFSLSIEQKNCLRYQLCNNNKAR